MISMLQKKFFFKFYLVKNQNLSANVWMPTALSYLDGKTILQRTFYIGDIFNAIVNWNILM